MIERNLSLYTCFDEKYLLIIGVPNKGFFFLYIREIYRHYYEKKGRQKPKTKIKFMEVTIMTNNAIKEMNKERYVITKDGIRMSYKEYMDMIKAERD